MIAEPSTILAVGDIDLAVGHCYFPGFRLTQFRAIARADPVLTVGEVAPMIRRNRFTGLRFGELGAIARRQTVHAVGQIVLVIGDGQGNRFRLGKRRVVTSIVAVSAVRNVSCMTCECHLRQLGRSQFGAITSPVPTSANLKIIGEIGILSGRQNRP